MALIEWRYPASSAALTTVVGEKKDGLIRARASRGVALAGPLLDLPPGACTVRVPLAAPGAGRVRMELTADRGQRVLASATIDLAGGSDQPLVLSAVLDDYVEAFEVRVTCRWGTALAIRGVEIDVDRRMPEETVHAGRRVGFESAKSYADKIASGFFDRYLSGPNVMEIGYKGYHGPTVPIVPQAIGVDVGYPGYEGAHFPFADGSLDAIYSSHCFEHIADWLGVLKDWWRMLKVGGHLIIVVPHRDLFERKARLPSPINPDHKRFYTSKSLLEEIETAFPIPNTWRIRHLVENDAGFDYDIMPYTGTDGAYEIELVIEKLERPFWNLDDGSVRAYPAGDFRTSLPGADPWELTLDLSQPNQCLVFGPYVALGIAQYEADFYFEWDGEVPDLLVDVAHFAERVASVDVKPGLHDGGKVTVPFFNPEDGGIYEFRTYAGGRAGTSRPKFKGVVVRYSELR